MPRRASAIIGRYILTGNILDCFQNRPTGAGGEIQLGDGWLNSFSSEKSTAVCFRGDRYDMANNLVRGTTSPSPFERRISSRQVLEYLKEVTR